MHAKTIVLRLTKLFFEVRCIDFFGNLRCDLEIAINKMAV